MDRNKLSVCPHIDEPLGCYRVRCQLGSKCVDTQSQPKAEKQKPVAWMDEYGDVLSADFVDGNGLRNIPLYTAPPQREWVGLTDDEYQAILKEHDGAGLLAFYNLIEAKLREKNGG